MWRALFTWIRRNRSQFAPVPYESQLILHCLQSQYSHWYRWTGANLPQFLMSHNWHCIVCNLNIHFDTEENEPTCPSSLWVTTDIALSAISIFTLIRRKSSWFAPVPYESQLILHCLQSQYSRWYGGRAADLPQFLMSHNWYCIVCNLNIHFDTEEKQLICPSSLWVTTDIALSAISIFT